MSSRTPIQVPEELKTAVDGLKDQFHAKTHYEVIEALIKQYEAFQRFQRDQREKWEAEQRRQQAEAIQVGADVKSQFDAFAEDMGVKPSQAIDLLLSQWSESPGIGHITFGLYRSFK